MNNKGVTLIELLVVIVVIGIISAFAVPAVGDFIDSARQQAVYQDAIAVRNAAAWYCAQPDNTCVGSNNTDWATRTDTDALDYGDIRYDMDGFDAGAYYTNNNYWLAYLRTDGTWRVRLEAGGTAAGSGDWEWNNNQGDPISNDASDTNVD